MIHFGELVRRNGTVWPEATVFTDGERAVTWSDFDRQTDALAWGLKSLGVGRGDRVAMLSPDCIELAEVFIACTKLGAIRVGINARLAPREIAHLLDDSGANLVIVHTGLADAATEALAAVSGPVRQIVFAGEPDELNTLAAVHRDAGPFPDTPHETAMLAYTTGSTGMPKGAVYPHKAMLRSIFYIALAEGMRREDVILHAMPAGGIPIMHMLRNLYHGAKTVIVGAWNTEHALALIEQERTTITVLVPTQLTAMLKSPDFDRRDLSSMRLIGYGAAPLPPAAIREGMERFGCSFLQMYGTTELMGMAMMLYPDDHVAGLTERPEILASAGRPLPFVETRIVDDDGNDVPTGATGELIIKSEFTIREYWQAAETYAETVRDGWLYTGDMARCDAAGFIYLGDRAKFRIKTGGYNVFPTEVENVLAEHNAVHEICVVGLPDPTWGERIHAVVTLKPDARVSVEALRSFCDGKIAAFKIPKSVEIWPDLPKGATGKILKRAVIETCTRELSND